MFGLGPTELAIIAVIVLLIFGAKRLPEIGKGLGSAIREFKNVKKELTSKDNHDVHETGNKLSNKKEESTLEAKVENVIMEKIPGVKEVKAIKQKADKVKQILK